MRRLPGILAIAAVALAGGAPTDAATPPRVRSSDWIVQFEAGVPATQQRALVRAAGGEVTRDLHLIRGLGVRLPGGARARLADATGVRAVTPNAATAPAGGSRWETFDSASLETSFVQSTRADKVWTQPTSPATGAGVAVAVVDTGIAGDLPEFRASVDDPTSRVVASVVTHPDATTATDLYGHGTHVAGLVAGSGRALDPTDLLYERYSGTAPRAKLVSVKVSDDHGNSTVVDVIAGLQFVVDHGADYGVRVVNLSLGSTVPMSYNLDPLDAAVEEVWAHGIVVVAAAGNRGTDPDAVSYAPANDPYVITVGAVDDRGTKDTADDSVASWSSRGLTQDGHPKPDLVAPGAHIAAPLAPDSDFNWLCQQCVIDDRYFMLSGTSMAAPIVAGIAADILSLHPDWTPDQVKGALMLTAKYLPEAAPLSAGVGEIMAGAAAEVANPPNPNLALNAFVVSESGGSGKVFDAASWANTALANASWASASWASASWASASWASASWASASWSSASWASASWASAALSDASWADASWASASWASASWADNAEGDSLPAGGYFLPGGLLP
jgi:serine protease AprX